MQCLTVANILVLRFRAERDAFKHFTAREAFRVVQPARLSHFYELFQRVADAVQGLGRRLFTAFPARPLVKSQRP